MAIRPHSSPPPSSRSGFRISGFPPPPKSVRTWQVPASEQCETEKPGQSHADKVTPRLRAILWCWLAQNGFTLVLILAAAITLLVLAIRQLTK
jgi:hypothetical protein